MQAAQTNGHRNHIAGIRPQPVDNFRRLRVRPGMVALYALALALLLIYALASNPLLSLGAFFLLVLDVLAILAHRRPLDVIRLLQTTGRRGVGLRP